MGVREGGREEMEYIRRATWGGERGLVRVVAIFGV